MRYGIFSDIHSNLEAMSSVLDAMKKDAVEEYLFLGDAVGYHANPNEVIELIESLHCWKMVLGNHDAACLDKTPLSSFSPPATDAILWTRQRLTDKSLKFLEGLRHREEIGDITLVHASPFQSEEWHYLTQEEDLERNFRYFQGTVCFFGHVHKPFIAEQQEDGSVKILQEAEFTLKEKCRYLVNDGSAGQSRDLNPQACYIVYDSETRKLSTRRVEYDVAAASRKVLEAGLPEYLAKRLLSGK
jgi:diadenosine tetraphosphatase ApaH/serine/threonine PP2A family protein phosphatase